MEKLFCNPSALTLWADPGLLWTRSTEWPHDLCSAQGGGMAWTHRVSADCWPPLCLSSSDLRHPAQPPARVWCLLCFHHTSVHQGESTSPWTLSFIPRLFHIFHLLSWENPIVIFLGALHSSWYTHYLSYLLSWVSLYLIIDLHFTEPDRRNSYSKGL